MAQRKKWSSAAKFEIALLAIKGEATINEICNRYQVAPCQVHAWKKQLLEQGAELFARESKAESKAAVDQEQVKSALYEKIGQLTVERDFLKKSWDKFRGKNDED